MRRLWLTAAFLAAWAGAVVYAQPFNAQIQAALVTLGLWPYNGTYSNGECPAWNATTQQFEGGACAGGTTPAANVEAGTFGEGDFAFQDRLLIGSDGEDGAITDPPTSGNRLVRSAAGVLTIVTEMDGKFSIISNDTRTRLRAYGAVEDALDIFVTAPFLRVEHSSTGEVVAFSAAANNMLQLGVSNTAPAEQILKASNAASDPNVAGAPLTLLGGLGTGNAVGSAVNLATPNAGASGVDTQSYTTKLSIGQTVGSLVITTVVAPAGSGTRYLCINSSGVVSSSAAACSGT